MKLTENVYMVGGGAWGGVGLTQGPDCNVYLIDGGGTLALFDVGSGVPGSVDTILGHIQSHGFKPSQIGAIFLTHMHGDHLGGTAAMAKATGASVYAADITAKVLETGDEEVSCVRIARTAGIYGPDYRLAAHPGVKTVAGGDTNTIGNVRVDIVATPGHCDGHISLLARSGKRADLFTGDSLFWRGRINIQPIPDCSPQESALSLERMAALGQVDGLFPGHGAFTISGANRHIDAAVGHIRALRMPPTF